MSSNPTNQPTNTFSLCLYLCHIYIYIYVCVCVCVCVQVQCNNVPYSQFKSYCITLTLYNKKAVNTRKDYTKRLHLD